VTLKSAIIFVLPVLIFGLIFSTFQRLGQGASKIFAIALGLLCCSNFLATYMSHFVGEGVHSMDLSLAQVAAGNELVPLFNLQFPKIISNAFAMIFGVICGIFVPKVSPTYSQKILNVFDIIVSRLLSYISFVIPFFLFGFILKMQYDGMVLLLVRQYAIIVAVIIATLAVYISLFYFIASGLHPENAWRSMKNMIPAVICAFGSMSSASALPYTIVAVEKNTSNKSLAKSIVSITTNIHLLGDCIAIPIFIYAILKSFGLPQPSAALYLIFVIQFVVAKFSVAAVPGGGIIVMLPIIERCFGFNDAMSSLIFSLYVLMDPICTSANVLGNGAFAQLIDCIVCRFRLGNFSEESNVA
jgi:Na+/H+-dicarboxylate symporter